MKHLWRGWHWLHNFIDSQVLSWAQYLKQQLHLNAMGSEQNGRNFADIVKCNFLNEDDSILFQILLIFLTDPIDINLALVLVMTCRLVCAKPLPEAILTHFTVAYMHHPGLISQHALVNIKSHFEKIEPSKDSCCATDNRGFSPACLSPPGVFASTPGYPRVPASWGRASLVLGPASGASQRQLGADQGRGGTRPSAWRALTAKWRFASKGTPLGLPGASDSKGARISMPHSPCKG